MSHHPISLNKVISMSVARQTRAKEKEEKNLKKKRNHSSMKVSTCLDISIVFNRSTIIFLHRQCNDFLTAINHRERSQNRVLSLHAPERIFSIATPQSQMHRKPCFAHTFLSLLFLTFYYSLTRCQSSFRRFP